jgi:hypothetical protein
LRQALEEKERLLSDRRRADTLEDGIRLVQEEKAMMQQTLDLERSSYRKRLEALLFSADTDDDQPVRLGKRCRIASRPRDDKSTKVIQVSVLYLPRF